MFLTTASFIYNIQNMNCLYLLIISLLTIFNSSLTFNLDDTSSDSSNTIVIFRKSKPSIILFPNKQTITLNYPKQHRLAKFKFDGVQPLISFKDIDNLTGKQDIQEGGKSITKKDEQKANKVQKKTAKEKPKQDQIAQKTKPIQNKYPPLNGSYRLINPELFNLKKPQTFLIKNNHISYTICSTNTCEFSQQKSQIEVGSCTMVSRPECQAFSDLFYSDLRILAQLELTWRMEYSKGIYKFFNINQQLRLELTQDI